MSIQEEGISLEEITNYLLLFAHLLFTSHVMRARWACMTGGKKWWVWRFYRSCVWSTYNSLVYAIFTSVSPVKSTSDYVVTRRLNPNFIIIFLHFINFLLHLVCHVLASSIFLYFLYLNFKNIMIIISISYGNAFINMWSSFLSLDCLLLLW